MSHSGPKSDILTAGQQLDDLKTGERMGMQLSMDKKIIWKKKTRQEKKKRGCETERRVG